MSTKNILMKGMEETLQEIAALTEKISVKESKLDTKIVELQKEKTKCLETPVKELEELEERLMQLAQSHGFDGKTKQIEFAIGKIFAQKMPDKFEIEDTDVTIAMLEKRELQHCIKIEKSIIKATLSSLDTRVLKIVGVEIKEGKDKYYYKLAGIKTSTGLEY